MRIVDKECEDAIITASDFTICIKCPRFETNPNLLTAYYHQWAANIMTLKENVTLDPETQEPIDNDF